jgi:hypothetical protein
MHCTDHHPAPADLVLSATGTADAVRVAVEFRRTQGDSAFPTESGYRKLDWPDLQALAAADGVGLARVGERFELSLPWLAPA